MAKMMASIFRKTDYCYFGCCTHVDLRNRKQKEWLTESRGPGKSERLTSS